MTGLWGIRAGNLSARRNHAVNAAAKTPTAGTTHFGKSLSRRRNMAR